MVQRLRQDYVGCAAEQAILRKCLHDKNLEYARNGYRRQKAQKAEKKHKERAVAALPRRPHSIAWCVREAEKRGMSYGRFVGLGLDKEVSA